MKIWARPNALMRATADVVQAHPYKEARILKELSLEELKTLVLTIDAKAEEELATFSLVLSMRELCALCDYLPINTYHVNLEKIALVLCARMKEELYLRLLQRWMDAPNCLQLLSILGDCSSNTEWTRRSPIKAQYLEAWSQALQPLRAVAATCKERGNGARMAEKIESLGITPITNLSLDCYETLMSYASLDEFKVEGDISICKLLNVRTVAGQKRILLRLLTCAQKEFKSLLLFPKCYDIAFSLWGTPKKTSFSPTEAFAYQSYSWWFNYQQIKKTFREDMRRTRYWEQYLHLCTCERNARHAMLIMSYEHYVAIEFEDSGPVYIFEKDYFDAIARNYIRHENQRSELKSWLYHGAKICSREVHARNWEFKQNIVLKRLGII